MQKTERRKIILEKIKGVEFITTKELFYFAEQNSLSNITVRRDLKELEEEGYIKLSYGAVSLVKQDSDEEKSWNEKALVNINEKNKIAKFSNDNLLSDDEVIFVSAGSTCECFVRHINKKVKMLVTHSLEVFKAAIANSNIQDVTLLGGVFRRRSHCFLSKNTNQLISELYFSSVFFSANSVNENFSMFNSNEFEAVAIAIALAKTNKRVAMIDHTKFNSYDISKIVDASDYSYLVSDENEVTSQLTPPENIKLYLVK